MTTVNPTLVDFHAHFLTERYVQEAKDSGIQTPDGMPAWPTWTVQDHLTLMDRLGIDRAVLSISSPGVAFDTARAVSLAEHVNDFAAELVQSHPDRFHFFATLPLPDVPAAIVEIKRVKDKPGFLGITCLSNSDGIYLGDPSLEPLWELLEDIGGIAFVHPTSPPNWEAVSTDAPRSILEFPFETTRTAVDLIRNGVLDRHPRIRFLLPHVGGTLP
jgi:predicted TIM-barrel fold metal-dependent hydrolase